MKLSTGNSWLSKLYEFQEKLLLVYRENSKSAWNDRCFYLDENYNPCKNYTHRCVLDNEVVIEFDEEEQELNRKYAVEVVKRFRKDGIKCSMFHSGNKSYHVHCLLNMKEAKNTSLLKNTFMRYYCEGVALPDLRLASDNHLIRCELGKHEKTGLIKTLIRKDADYPCLSEVPQIVWDRYANRQTISVNQRMNRQVNDLSQHPGLKWIMSSEQFRESKDGRERALFVLIHVLKENYKDDKEGLIKFLIEWYHYSSSKGEGLTDQQIRSKVYYQWDKTYKLDRFVDELLESLGKSELIQK